MTIKRVITTMVHRTRAIQFVSLETGEGKKYDPLRSLMVGIPVPDVLGRGRCARTGVFQNL